MSGPLDDYTKRIALELQGHPDSQCELRWNGVESRFELDVTFNIERLFQEYAAHGDVRINMIPEGRRVATITMTYPIPAQNTLRLLNQALVSGLVSMLMGAAYDLAKADDA